MIVAYCLCSLGISALLGVSVDAKTFCFVALLLTLFPLLLQILFIQLAGHDVNHLVVEVVLFSSKVI